MYEFVCVCAGERERGGESVKEQEQARYEEATRRRVDEEGGEVAKWRSAKCEVGRGEEKNHRVRGARPERKMMDGGVESVVESVVVSSSSSSG